MKALYTEGVATQGGTESSHTPSPARAGVKR